MEDNERRWQSDNEEENEDEQEDAEWRKQRFEREKYLKEQKAKVTKQITQCHIQYLDSHAVLVYLPLCPYYILTRHPVEQVEDEGDGELFKLKLPTIVRSSSVTSENSTNATTTRKPLKAANPVPAPSSQPKVTANPFSILSKVRIFKSRVH